MVKIIIDFFRKKSIIVYIERKGKMKKYLIAFLKNIPFILGGLFLLWIFLGFCEVQIHNFNPNYVYSDWNFFIVLVNLKS